MQTHSRALWKPRVNPLKFPQHKQLWNFWPRPRTSKSSKLLGTQHCHLWEWKTQPVWTFLWAGTCLISGYGRRLDVSENSHHHPPHLHVLPRLAQVRTHPWNPRVLPQEYTPKKQAKSHIFHHHLKEREGNLCKVLQGAGQWWWLHWHGPSPNSIGILGGSLLSEEQRGCQNNTGNISHEKQGKATGKKTFTSDRRLHLISREHRELPLE